MEVLQYIFIPLFLFNTLEFSLVAQIWFYYSAGGGVSWWPYMLAVLGVFTMVTMWAVVVTEGCRKIKLQYYGFKLASATR